LEHEFYLTDLNDPSIEGDLIKASRIGVLGDVDFVEKIRRSYLKDRLKNPDAEILELKRLKPRPPLSLIKERVERELGHNNKLVKKCTIFLAREHADYRLKEIGAFFGMGSSSVSMALRRAKVALSANETVSRILKLIRDELSRADMGP
jgi:hypothetical protein